MTTDWRWQQLETKPYLRDVSFTRERYRDYSPEWEHDHCEACQAKLAEPSLVEDAVQEGYATTADYEMGAEYAWVCVPCFEEFRQQMGWVDATTRKSN